MRLLQINATYGYGSTGAIVKSIHSLAQANGIDSYVAYSKTDDAFDKGFLIGSMIEKKVHAILGRLMGKQAYYSTFGTKRLIKWIDHIQPDIVHLHNLHSNYINLNLLLNYLAEKQINVVLTQHDCWFFTGNCFHFFKNGCDKWKSGCGACPYRNKVGTKAYFSDKTDAVWEDKKLYFSKINRLFIVGCSKWITDIAKNSLLSTNRAHQFFTINNGVNLNIFTNRVNGFRERYGLTDKFIIFGMANKWFLEQNRKTVEYLVENLDSDISVVVVGCTEKQIEALPKSWIGLPFCNNKIELAELYSMSDVFVNLSWEDTLPTVNIESLSCGTPVIAQNCAGISDTVLGGTGYLVSAGDYNALIEAIRKVKILGKKSFSANCRSAVEQCFDENKQYYEYIKLYSRIMESNANEKDCL